MSEICLTLSNQLSACSKCAQETIFPLLPCNHSFCSICYSQEWSRRLDIIQRLIKSNTFDFNNKSLSIGCLFNCKESNLAIPPQWLCKLFESLNDKHHALLVSSLSTFFSGIPTVFLYCSECEAYYATIQNDRKCNHRDNKIL